jgi:hypothetical protein
MEQDSRYSQPPRRGGLFAAGGALAAPPDAMLAVLSLHTLRQASMPRLEHLPVPKDAQAFGGGSLNSLWSRIGICCQ